MSAANSGIFISSVQKELAEDRRAVKRFIENDPLLRRFFTVFARRSSWPVTSKNTVPAPS